MRRGSPWRCGGRQLFGIGSRRSEPGLCYALKDAGASVTIANRSPEQAQALTAELNIAHCPWEDATDVAYDVLINATSVGMIKTPAPGQPTRTVKGCIFDTVYTPLETRLLKDGAMADCRCQDGLRMFIRRPLGNTNAVDIVL